MTNVLLPGTIEPTNITFTIKSFHIDGSLKISTASHVVEYEPASMVGEGTLFLSLPGIDHVTPIHVTKVDAVIEMLQKMKKVVEALEE